MENSTENSIIVDGLKTIGGWLTGKTVREKIVETAVEKILDPVISAFQSEVSRYKNVEEGLGRLRRTSERIDSLLTDAVERRHIEDVSVKKWLRDLKSVSFDTDDLLDTYQTALNMHKKRKQYLMPSLGPERGPFQRRRFSTEIDKLDNKLEEIAKSRKTLRLRGSDGTKKEATGQSSLLFQTGSCHASARILGRENDKKEILKLLTPADASTSVSLPRVTFVLIHGAAGVGKTTLAQMVYDDPNLNFGIKAWVCLTERCDVSTAMKKIYEKMTGLRCDSGDFGTLQERLREHLKKRPEDKFLLVIDNLWASDFRYLEILRAPLLAGGKGSKVIITTRYERTCQVCEPIQRVELTGLDDKDCWLLIQSLALPQGIGRRTELVPIGEGIARRCNGSPMAAKALGALLNGRSDEEWSHVLREMQALKDDINEPVLASLKISYHHLRYHLKQCFGYCSIFPNGYLFERDQVIRYWIAEGLIQPDGGRRLEAIGIKYFDDLLWRSFFEKVPICDKGRVEQYRMPSLMHDLAKHVSEYEFQGVLSGNHDRVLQSRAVKEAQVRYASFTQLSDNNILNFECIEPYSHLRTLKFSHERSNGLVPLKSTPARFFCKFVHLRVLDMSNSDLEQVPNSVGELIHLRFLGLSNTKIRTLPEKICDLFNLQTLELKDCSQLQHLPKGLQRLFNLRHLDLHLEWEEITDSTEVTIPRGIGQLGDLQTLSRFNVVSDKGQECNMIELNHLNLRGDLCILNLEKVPTRDAKNANLEEKQYIEKLMLRWHISARTNKRIQQESEEVIKAIKPDKGLRCLWVVNYPGTRYPAWIGDTSFGRLETIRISNCKNFKFLSLVGKLPRLVNLQIDNVPGDTMSILEGFQSMEHLFLQNLKSVDYITLQNLRSLRKLTLENEMPELKIVSVSGCSVFPEVVMQGDLLNRYGTGTLKMDLERIFWNRGLYRFCEKSEMNKIETGV